MVAAPGLFSTTTGWPRLSVSFWPTRRARMSLTPPGLAATTMCIGLVGKALASSVWARAIAVGDNDDNNNEDKTGASAAAFMISFPVQLAGPLVGDRARVLVRQ